MSKLVIPINASMFSPYELSFLLNNLDFYISNRENIIETINYTDDIIQSLYHYILYYEKTETFIDEIGDEKLEKIILDRINIAGYKGYIDIIDNQWEHPQIRVDRKKTYNKLKTIIKKIRDEKTFIEKDGKKRSKKKSKRKSKKRSKRSKRNK